MLYTHDSYGHDHDELLSYRQPKSDTRQWHTSALYRLPYRIRNTLRSPSDSRCVKVKRSAKVDTYLRRTTHDL